MYQERVNAVTSDAPDTVLTTGREAFYPASNDGLSVATLQACHDVLQPLALEYVALNNIDNSLGQLNRVVAASHPGNWFSLSNW